MHSTSQEIADCRIDVGVLTFTMDVDNVRSVSPGGIPRYPEHRWLEMIGTRVELPRN